MIMAFRMALRSIASNKMRAALTMLGIIIGVMALVVLVSLVNGATGSITDAVAELGSNRLTILINDSKGSPVHLSDLDEWKLRNPSVGITAAYSSSSLVAKGGEDYKTATVYGVTPSYYDVENLQLYMGRWLKNTDTENSSPVCIINKTGAENLVGYSDCVGNTISINAVRYTVVGIIEDNESLTSMLLSGSCVIYVPLSSLVKLTDTISNEVTSFYVKPAENFTQDDVKETLNEILLQRFDDDKDAFTISSINILEDAMSDITSVLEILLGGIAAISLIVGGIGIMNIMLVTVTERTREIGIRKAIGATRGTILTQFLMEAVVLCMMGCALGIFISWSILQLISTVVSSLDMSFSLDGGVVLLSVIFCFIIGIAFGLYPANKAAKMKPIDALHYGG